MGERPMWRRLSVKGGSFPIHLKNYFNTYRGFDRRADNDSNVGFRSVLNPRRRKGPHGEAQ